MTQTGTRVEGSIQCANDECGKIYKTRRGAFNHQAKTYHEIGTLVITWQLKDNGKIDMAKPYLLDWMGGIPDVEGFGKRGGSNILPSEWGGKGRQFGG